MTAPRRVLEAVRARRDALAELVLALARAESPSSDPAAVEPAFSVLAAALQDAGLRTARFPGRRTGGLLLARPAERRRGPFQLVIGHVDTVWPVGTAARMAVARDGDRIRGPGVYDMKGGLAQIVVALRALRAVELRPDVEVVVAVNADEEIGSRETRRHLVRLARGADRAWILEPSLGLDGRLKTARKGVGRYEVVVHGVAAHAGLDPTAGASAILELSHQIQRLFALNDPASGVTVNVGTIDGGLRPNVVAPRAAATVDVRVPTAAEAARVDAAIRGLAPVIAGTRLEVSGGIGRPPMERSEGVARLWGLARAAGDALGLALDEATAGGGSDGNTTAAWTPTLDGLGPVGDGAHAAHEHLSLEHLIERTALLALLLLAPALREAR